MGLSKNKPFLFYIFVKDFIKNIFDRNLEIALE